ncbi:hypothetical protein RRG08_010325 [Elysia crispata]|uniref:Uncharacterized protein n=1 Tax=Elysia crispata TaxID=231223 RepID=A0AAE1CTL7_9GAST|nr:hypothetical protein RRG08_010325 [Elysia crispata]
MSRSRSSQPHGPGLRLLSLMVQSTCSQSRVRVRVKVYKTPFLKIQRPLIMAPAKKFKCYVCGKDITRLSHSRLSCSDFGTLV